MKTVALSFLINLWYDSVWVVLSICYHTNWDKYKILLVPNTLVVLQVFFVNIPFHTVCASVLQHQPLYCVTVTVYNTNIETEAETSKNDMFIFKC